MAILPCTITNTAYVHDCVALPIVTKLQLEQVHSSLPRADAKQAAMNMITPTKKFHVLFQSSWLSAMLRNVPDSTLTAY